MILARPVHRRAAAAAIFATPPPPTVKARRAAADDRSVEQRGGVTVPNSSCGHMSQQNSILVRCLCVFGLIFWQDITHFFM